MFWLYEATMLPTGESGTVHRKCAPTLRNFSALETSNVLNLDEHLDFLNSAAPIRGAINFQNIV